MTNPNNATLAIVGRPNVGKSSLFNAILGRRVAIVHEQSGVTRDRIAAPASHDGKHFLLVDTGGVGVFRDDRHVETFAGLVRDQVEKVIEEADQLIFLVDAMDGATPLDKEIACFLRESSRPVCLVANKCDNSQLSDAAVAEFQELGLGAPLPLSCVHRRGLDRVLTEALKDIEGFRPQQGAQDDGLSLAVIGRPNVGKSSLVNKLLGEDRVIVSEVAGTTRDAIDIPIEVISEDGTETAFKLIDTAGLRRKRQVDTAVELFSTMRAENAIRRSDVVLLVIDAQDPATSQDRRIARLVSEARKPCVLIANKWDLACRERKLRDLRDELSVSMKFMSYAPILGVSALSGYNLDQVIGAIMDIREQLGVRIPTAVINQFLADLVARTPPPAGAGGKRLKVLYATMGDKPSPHFVVFVNHKRLCTASYLAFLENRLREAFFPDIGIPVWIELRARRGGESDRTGARKAAAGIQSARRSARRAEKRHSERRKGWRKRK